MKLIIFCLVIFVTFFEFSEELQNLLNTPMHDCIKCLCHARTGCYRRRNCASYSINNEYWVKAGSPTLTNDNPHDPQSYERCMYNENCILNTIVGYTNTFDNMDCNCDGRYDCQDMLKLHLYGENCGTTLQYVQMMRFNNCASNNNISSIAKNDYCEVEVQ